jgi:hypothetical protein
VCFERPFPFAPAPPRTWARPRQARKEQRPAYKPLSRRHQLSTPSTRGSERKNTRRGPCPQQSSRADGADACVLISVAPPARPVSRGARASAAGIAQVGSCTEGRTVHTARLLDAASQLLLRMMLSNAGNGRVDGYTQAVESGICQDSNDTVTNKTVPQVDIDPHWHDLVWQGRAIASVPTLNRPRRPCPPFSPVSWPSACTNPVHADMPPQPLQPSDRRRTEPAATTSHSPSSCPSCHGGHALLRIHLGFCVN